MAMKLITTNPHTGDSDDESLFTSGIDSTYKLYIFKYYNINPADDAVDFRVQFNASSQTGYNEYITSTTFMAHQYENDSSRGVSYSGSYDQAQGTSPQIIAENIGNAADENASGELYLFNPSNTTYVTHFYGRASINSSSYGGDMFSSGYINVAAAIINVKFSMESGNFNGVIKMYGVG